MGNGGISSSDSEFFRLQKLYSQLNRKIRGGVVLVKESSNWILKGDYDSSLRFLYENSGGECFAINLRCRFRDPNASLSKIYTYDFNRNEIPSFNRLVDSWNKYISQNSTIEKIESKIEQVLTDYSGKYSRENNGFSLKDRGREFRIKINERGITLISSGLRLDVPDGKLLPCLNLACNYLEI